MSHMKEVAKILGVELGEEFGVKDSLYKLRITDKNVEYYYDLDESWNQCNYRLARLLSGDEEIIKLPQPILTEKEKEYLSAVVKPFRDEFKHISKNQYDDEEWIQIRTKSSPALLPPFKEGLMYKGMKVDKEYSVKELDI